MAVGAARKMGERHDPEAQFRAIEPPNPRQSRKYVRLSKFEGSGSYYAVNGSEPLFVRQDGLS
jgi:hypothetical protein